MFASWAIQLIARRSTGELQVLVEYRLDFPIRKVGLESGLLIGRVCQCGKELFVVPSSALLSGAYGCYSPLDRIVVR